MLTKIKADLAKCQTLRFTNSSGSTITAGTWRVEGSVLGIVLDDVPDGEEGIMVVYIPVPGVQAPKESTTATFSVGERVYWDVADEEFNEDSASNKAAGYAYMAAGATDTEVRIVLTNEVPIS